MLARLIAAGIATLVVHTIPYLNGYTLATCPYVRILVGEAGCGIVVDRRVIEAQKQPARDAETLAVDGLGRSATIDFTSELCSANECRAWGVDGWAYRDNSHLTVQAGRSLAARFTAAIADVLH